MIMTGLPQRCQARPCLVHQRAHPADGGLEAGEDRFADQKMADIEFADFGDGGDGLHSVEAQAMSGMNFQSERCAIRGGLADFVEQPSRSCAFAMDAASQ